MKRRLLTRLYDTIISSLAWIILIGLTSHFHETDTLSKEEVLASLEEKIIQFNVQQEVKALHP